MSSDNVQKPAATPGTDRESPALAKPAAAVAADESAIRRLWSESIRDASAFSSGALRETFKPPLADSGVFFGKTASTKNQETLPTTPPDPNAVIEETPQASISGYALLEKIGEGGMGVVYRARQSSLMRDVAIKTVKGGREAERTFKSEAYVTGFLDHPNIIPVHALGEDNNGRTFLSMKLIGGVSWLERMRTARSGVSPETGPSNEQIDADLRILLVVCNAVAFAHSRGVLHRDLKPENVMLGDFGEILVVDWGIAVDLRETPETPVRTIHKTQAIYPAGTPAYMAPEMAVCDGDRLGPWTDVYLLGAILYEILTGDPPHNGASLAQTLLAAAESSPRVFKSSVPKRLADICRKAMAKEPSERFETVEAFRSSIENYLSGEAKRIESRDVSNEATVEFETIKSEIGGEAVRLYKTLSDIQARLLRALTLWPGNRNAIRLSYDVARHYAERALEHGDLTLARAQTETMNARAELIKDNINERAQIFELRARIDDAERIRSARQRNMRYAVRAVVALLIFIIAGGLFFLGKLKTERDRAIQADETARAARLEAEQRLQETEAAWAAAKESERLAELELERKKQQIYFNNINRAKQAWEDSDAPKMRRLLIDCPEDLRNWEWGYLKRLARLDVVINRDRRDVKSMTYSSVSDQLAVATSRALAVYDGRSGDPRIELNDIGDETISDIAFSPDGLWVAIARNQSVTLLDVATGNSTIAFSTPSNSIALAFSPDGERIAVALSSGTVSLYGIKDGETLWTTREMLGLCADLSFSPDGKTLLFNGSKTSIILQAATGATGRTLPGPIARYSPDGKLLLVSSGDSGIDIANASNGRTIRSIPQTSSVVCAAFSGDGQWLATSLSDKTIIIWRADIGTRVLTLKTSSVAAVKDLVFSEDCERLYAVGRDSVHIWNVSSALGYSICRNSAGGFSLAFSPDSRSLAGTAGQFINIWNAETRTLDKTIKLEKRGSSVIYHPDGDYLAVSPALPSDPVVVLDVRTGQTVATYANNLSVRHQNDFLARAMSFSADGKTLMFGDHDGNVSLWDMASGLRRHQYSTATSSVTSLTVSRDGRWIASGAWTGDICVYSIADNALVERVENPGDRIQYIDFSPNGQTILFGMKRRHFQLYRLADRQLLLSAPEDETGLSCSAAFSPDGARIFLTAGNRMAVIDSETGTELISMRYDAVRSFSSAAFAPDGRRVAAGDTDNVIRVWDADPWSIRPLFERSRTDDASALLALADIYEENDKTPYFTIDAPLELALGSLERAAEIDPSAQPRLNAFKEKHYLPLYYGIAERAEKEQDGERLMEAANNLIAYHRSQPHQREILARAIVFTRRAADWGAIDAPDALRSLAAEYPDLRVEIFGSRPGETFDAWNGSGWMTHSGYWLYENGAIVGKSARDAYLVADEPHPDRFRLRVEMSCELGNEISVWFAGSADNTERDGYFIGVSDAWAKLQKQAKNVQITERAKIEQKKTHILTVEKDDGRIRAFLDDSTEPFIDWTDPEPLVGDGHQRWGFYIFYGSVKVVNYRIDALE